MTVSARQIALQGVGFGAQAAAVQGLAGVVGVDGDSVNDGLVCGGPWSQISASDWARSARDPVAPKSRRPKRLRDERDLLVLLGLQKH